MLTDRHMLILEEERHLDIETVARFGVESFVKRDGGNDWIRIPYVLSGQVVNWKYRTIGASVEKRFHQEEGGTKCFWNFEAITNSELADMPLIVTEGEIDALTAIQCGFERTVSVPDGAPAQAQGEDDHGRKYSYLTDAKASLSGVREIIICADSDGPGINLLNDLALRLGKGRCKWVKYPQGCKDLNDALVRFGARGVTETINRAQWMRVDGIYRMSELPPVPERIAHDLGLPILRDHYNVRPGDFGVITGIPSHGKSSFLNEVAGRMVNRHRWTVAFASFEQQTQVDHRRALRTYFGAKPAKYQSAAELGAADDWIDANFSFIVPGEDDDVTLDWTLDRCAASIIQHNARMVVIDPWNEMDHVRPPDMSLTEYVGFAIKQFRKLASKYLVHVAVAAHPTKQRRNEDGQYSIPTLYDISDSAHWYNKADVGLVIHRLNETRTLIRVAKSRYHELIGKPGDVQAMFDHYSHRFTVVEDLAPEDLRMPDEPAPAKRSTRRRLPMKEDRAP